MNVGAAVTISESGIEASGIGITVANINGGAIDNRNILINGSFIIAQRGTSVTSANAYIVDRWKLQSGALDENCTQEQADVSSGTEPYKLGFRKCWKITNGNQTSGGGANDYIELYSYIEGQNLVNCGWDFKNPNSKMTLSFWIKSSVAQTFPGFLYTTASNGTSVEYMYDYVVGNGTSNLTADTWTKVVHTFPGNANLNITNGPNYGMGFGIYPYSGTNLTTDRAASNAWSSWVTANKTPDVTSTWYTTNNATLEFTGFQLEVGPQATPFKHRSFGEELALCQRYYYKPHISASNLWPAYQYHSQYKMSVVQFPVTMRATPTCTASWGSGSDSDFTQHNNSKDHFKAYRLANYDDGAAYYLDDFVADAEL
tara:strand:- start:231 stop:1343 length:1113 start_codon:yes stop_codon:yes gene_type:complete